MSEVLLPFVILTWIFYEILVRRSRKSSKAISARGSSFLELEDREHKQALAEFDSLLHGGTTAEPLRDTQEVTAQFIESWVSYLIQATYSNEISWKTGKLDSYYTEYITPVTLDVGHFEVELRISNTKAKALPNLKIYLPNGRVVKRECAPERGEELLDLVRASSKNYASPAEMLSVVETLKKHV